MSPRHVSAEFVHPVEYHGATGLLTGMKGTVVLLEMTAAVTRAEVHRGTLF